LAIVLSVLRYTDSNYLFGIFKLFLHWNIEEEQTTQWLKEKVQKDKHGSTKHTNKIKDPVTRTPLKPGMNSGAPEG
jgi:hypothetical protein